MSLKVNPFGPHGGQPGDGFEYAKPVDERCYDSEISYRPGIEVTRLFNQFNKWAPWLFGSSAAIFLIGMPMGLEHWFFIFAKAMIAPFKFYFLHKAASNEINLDWLDKVMWPIFLAIGGVLAWVTVNEAFKPTHLRLTEDGMDMFRWSSFRTSTGTIMRTERQFTGSLSWKDVKLVRLERKTGMRSHLDCTLVFEKRSGGVACAIRYGDIENPFERMKFVGALERHLGARVQPEIKQVFSDKGERESYTELWLRELNAPPKRDKLVPLSANMTLHNGEYTVKQKIGLGGQAAVYLAESAKLPAGQNLVAIKEFILPVFPDPRVRVAAAERFQTEAELISRIKHPQIVRFLDLFIEDHRAYLVLERISGMNLKQFVESHGVMNEEQVRQLAIQMCDILSYLHNQVPPIAHRDFTPDNLMLTEEGRLKLIDFSVAQASISNVTGSVVGKPEFIAPEQFRGKPSPLSDLYSLGGTMYYLLTGENPQAISVSKPVTCSPAMSQIISCATALDAKDRYQSADDLKNALLSLGTKGGVIEVATAQPLPRDRGK
jgi:tRNA A-37 threonylcarbamoyl transferase component Bud32